MKFVQIGVIAVYVIITITFIVLQKKDVHSDNFCDPFEHACVSFCCKNKETCTRKFIDENFNMSLIPASDTEYEWSLNETYIFNPILDAPSCVLKEEKEKYKFTSVSEIIDF